MEDNEKLMCLDCEYFTLIDIEQAEAYPWCDAHNKSVLPTDYCQYFTKKHRGVMMTNEEKAKDLTLSLFAKNFIYFNSISQRKAVEKTLVMMAEWKNEQYNEEKKELIGLVNMLPVDDHNQTIIEDLKALLQ